MIAGATVALTAGLGARRAASGPSGLALGLGLLLASAGACYTIAQTKTGGFLPGIIGALLALLMLTAAGGLVLGALARWLWAALRRTPDAGAGAELGPLAFGRALGAGGGAECDGVGRRLAFSPAVQQFGRPDRSV